MTHQDMSFDPLADPLSPEWRARVDWAVRNIEHEMRGGLSTPDRRRARTDPTTREVEMMRQMELGLPQAEIARSFGVSRQRIGQMVSACEKRGWVRP